MRIGFQGEHGSNSDQAAKNIVEALNYDGVEYLPLVTSARVIEALKSGDIDYGVLAVENSIGGTVEETAVALRDVNVKTICSIVLDVHHCLFIHPDVSWDDIDCIASHIQALKQTEETRRCQYPELRGFEIEDTAIGAKYLANRELDTNIAVLCPAAAGELYGLRLVAKNLEDKPSRTRFVLIKISQEQSET